MIHKVTCIDVIGVDRCTGCFGCQSACQQGAIRLLLDAEGFYKPLVNRDICNGCALCLRRCPIVACDEGRLPAEKWLEPKAFAAWSLDEEVRLASTSGGLFSELARPVIEAGGVVAGCVWGAEWTPQHVLARTWEEVKRMRGSKYVPSKIGDIYADILKHLRETKAPVLFCGTPCQVAALEMALSSEQRERVVLVDLICAGVPSLNVFHCYLRELFRGEAVVSYNFREKSFGWSASSVKAESASRCSHHMKVWNDPFVAGFLVHHLYMMAACHGCIFARMPRGGDITLGDFWGCPDQWNDKRGVSVALANTPLALRTFDTLVHSGRINLHPADLATVITSNQHLVNGVCNVSDNRRSFLNGVVAGQSFGTLKKKYFPKEVPKWRARWIHFWSTESKLEYVTEATLRLLQRVREKLN